MQKLIFTLSLSLILISLNCARFKVTKLQANEIFSIPLQNSDLEFPVQNKIYHEIPARVGIVDDYRIIAQPSIKSINIFKKNKLETRIVARKAIKKTNVKKSVNRVINDQLQIPGLVIGGKNEDFFVVNYSEFKKVFKDKTALVANQSGFYKILHFDVKGKLIHVIGNTLPELPFEQIIWIDVDSDNNLWILHRANNEIFLDRYSGSQRTLAFDEDKCLDVLGIKSSKNVNASCEYLYPFYNGEKILAVGKQEKVINQKKGPDHFVFENRILKTFDAKTLKVEDTIFSNLNDPEDLPYLPYDDNHVLIWQYISASEIKYAIYNLEGDLTNNLKIKLGGRRSMWRTTFFSLERTFYSIKIENSSFKIIEWK